MPHFYLLESYAIFYDDDGERHILIMCITMITLRRMMVIFLIKCRMLVDNNDDDNVDIDDDDTEDNVDDDTQQ